MRPNPALCAKRAEQGFLHIVAAAACCGFSSNGLTRAVRQGRIKGEKTGARIFVHLNELCAYFGEGFRPQLESALEEQKKSAPHT